MNDRLSRLFPPRIWLKQYRRTTLIQDAIAAVLMTILVIPQSLAYAMLAGLPPETGLYASILPVIGYALFASSHTMAVGPVALIALMSATTVAPLSNGDPAVALGASLTLALLCGLYLFAMGIARLGFIANFISHPVISGFISGSAVLIILSQLGTLLAIPASGANLPDIMGSIVTHLERFNALTLLIGVGALIMLLAGRRHTQPLLIRLGLGESAAGLLQRLVPMVAVLVTTVATASAGLGDAGVAVVGVLPQGLPGLTLPSVNLAMLETLAVPAFLISLVIFVESASIAHRMAARRGERIDPDQELMGLGAANVLTAVSGGFAVAGGFSRTVVNDQAGAQTQVAGVLTAVGIGLVTVFFTDLFHYLPKATLAAIIMAAAVTLIDTRSARDTWRYSRQDGLALLATFLLTVFAGVIPGILTGVALSLLLYLYRTSKPHIAVVGRLPGTEHFRNEQRYAVETNQQLIILRVDEALYFANARYLEDRISEALRDHPAVTDCILMCSGVNMIDASALETLEAINTRLDGAGVRLHLSEVKGPVMDRLETTPFMRHLSGRVFLSTFDAWQSLNTISPDTTAADNS
ncbi:SulP family inorganic anion transporter [Marinobacter bohaiensis]|uniref:SulP family inorganic anion transporter n=1 Tax=Marinobacter bohaiensis TaxID=2201898 RepID=UPI000DAD08B8|nr:SulP family inorganic anion transporter [Marinobacter bohaiensis]